MALGEGRLETLDIPDAPTDLIKIPSKCLLPPSSSITDLINFTFPSLHSNYRDTDYLASRALLAPTNAQTKLLNEAVLELLPDVDNTKQVLSSADTVGDDDDIMMYNTDVLNQIEISGLPPHKLVLQRFAVVMLLRNLDPERGLVNGARMIVLSFTRTLVTARLITGNLAGTTVLIPRITLSPNDGRFPFQLKRLQFPLKLAYCMTINKSQGQTLKRVGLYLPEPVFDHGQLFVAFSRVGLPADIKLLILHNASQGTFKGADGVYTRNMVYKSILLQLGIVTPDTASISSDSFDFNHTTSPLSLPTAVDSSNCSSESEHNTDYPSSDTEGSY